LCALRAHGRTLNTTNMAAVVRPDFISGGKMGRGGKSGAAHTKAFCVNLHTLQFAIWKAGQDTRTPGSTDRPLFSLSLLRSFGGKPPCHPPGRTSSIWALHRPIWLPGRPPSY